MSTRTRDAGGQGERAPRHALSHRDVDEPGEDDRREALALVARHEAADDLDREEHDEESQVAWASRSRTPRRR